MSQQAERSQFEVADHIEIKNHGVFVIGDVLGGKIRLGMQVNTGLEPPTLTICRVEIVYLKGRKYLIALRFTERPSLEFIKRAFPVGSFIEVRAGE